MHGTIVVAANQTLVRAARLGMRRRSVRIAEWLVCSFCFAVCPVDGGCAMEGILLKGIMSPHSETPFPEASFLPQE
jgi:hypothetical protein